MLYTERLVLKPVEEMDVDVYRRVLSSDSLTQFLPKGAVYSEPEILQHHANRVAHWRKYGTGSALYHALMEALKLQGVHRALSGIALPNEASIALHKKFGFREVGVFDSYAKKNGSYISSVWLEKLFG